MDTEEIVGTYGEQVSRLVRRMVCKHELSEDICQEIWYEVIKSLHSFKHDSKLSTWIFTIAKRTIYRHIKQERILTHEDIDSCIEKGQIGFDDSDDRKEDWIKEKCDDCITAFCQCLNKEQRLIFLFRENLNLTYDQISSIMELKEDNVRKIASRSLKKVRSFMTKDCILINPQGRCGCRIREVIKSVDFDRVYRQIGAAHRLVTFYNKFDKELPRKNYWEKLINESPRQSQNIS